MPRVSSVASSHASQALEQAGIDRGRTYITNVVKHFKWEPRGKRRIHAKPNAGEIAACRPWLESEIALLHPRAIVCLGATAAKALLGREAMRALVRDLKKVKTNLAIG